MKNRLFLSLFALLFSLNTTAQTAEFLAHYTIDEVSDVMVQFGVPEGFIDLQYEVDFYRVEYRTLHPNGDSIDVTGALCLPSNLDCPLPLSSYQHGTVALKTNVPSYENGESQLGLLYACAGYAITMPDYIGLGDSPGLHLYVHAESEARASLDLIRAAYDLQETLDFTLDDQLFLWGYSQGGHATMALHRMIELDYPDEFEVSVAAPMSGPYDISGVQADVITSDEEYPTPGYLPYVILSYQEVYGNLYDDLEDLFLPQYAAIIPDLFDGENSMGFINNQFPDVPSQALLPGVLESFENDPNNPIRLALEDNDVYDWAPQSKTVLYYCEGDDQVGFMNSIVARDTMIANGAMDVTANDGGMLDHGDCAPGAMLAGFLRFELDRIDTFDPIVTVDVSPNSDANNPNGSISVEVENSEADWTYEWDNGASGTDLENLEEGTYTLTVADTEGCSTSVTVDVDFGVGIEEESALTNLSVDPEQRILYVNKQGGRLLLFDMQGRVLFDRNVKANESVALGDLPTGVYVAGMDNGSKVRFYLP